MKKKVSKTILLAVVLIISFTMLSSIVSAYSDQSINFSFIGVTGGYGGVNGSVNGKYYSLSPSSAHTGITCTLTDVPDGWPYSSKTCAILLYREVAWWFDAKMGEDTLTFTQNGTYNYDSWTVDQDCAKYYLYITGGDAGFEYSGTGTMHDH